MYGMSTSPILHGDRLILVLDDDANLEGSELSRSRLVALNKQTGETMWETPRPFNRSNWSTPMIWEHEQGTDLVVLGNGRVYGYHPWTGSEKWYVEGFSRETISIPVAGRDHLFVSASMQGGRGDVRLDPEPFWNAMLRFDQDEDGRVARTEITEQFTFPIRPELPLGHPGFGIPLPTNPEARSKRQQDIFNWRDKNQDGYWTREEFVEDMEVGRGRPNLAAIRPGGQGNATDSHVDWTLRRGIPEIPSPIYHAGYLYLVRDGGFLRCVRADDGEVMYRERLGTIGQYAASPVIANGRLYLFSATGTVTVVATGETFQISHQADLGENVQATPALDEDTLYLRTKSRLVAYRQGN